MLNLLLLERGVVYHSSVSPVAKTLVSVFALLPHTSPQGVMASAIPKLVSEKLIIIKNTGSANYTTTSKRNTLKEKHISILLSF